MKVPMVFLTFRAKAQTAFGALIAGYFGLMSCAAWAATDATAQGGASTGPNLSGVGKALGMVLFGYLVMKWANRSKSDEDEPRGFFGQRIKPVYVWLVLILGLIVLMSRTG